MKNVRSSGSASRLVMRYQLIQEVTRCEFPFTCFNPKSRRLYELFQHICLSSNATSGSIFHHLIQGLAYPLDSRHIMLFEPCQRDDSVETSDPEDRGLEKKNGLFCNGS